MRWPSNNLASVYQDLGKYADAEVIFKRALTIKEKALGPNHPDVATNLDNLAVLYSDQGRYADAEPLSKRALAIREKALGPNHPQVATHLNNLANLYREQGRYADAEPLYKRALAIDEKALGPNHPNVATSLNNLAVLYLDQGRYADAEPLLKRALAIGEKALGPDHPGLATDLNNLAGLYLAQGRYADAEPLYKRALAIDERTLGPDHPGLATDLNNLALLYRDQGRYADAEPLYKRALAVREKALGPDHPEVATTLYNLANLYGDQGRYADAEPLHKRALAIDEKALGPDHPEVARSLDNLAELYREIYRAQGRHAGTALAFSRRASAAVIAHAESAVAGTGLRAGSGLVEQRTEYFRRHVSNLAAAAREQIEPEGALAREAFEIAQWASQSAAAAAVQQMAERFSIGSGALAGLVRERQDLAISWRERDKALIAALSKPAAQQGQTIEALRQELTDIEGRIANVTARLEKGFPDYAALARPKPLKAEQAQALLGADEALLFWLALNKESYVFALTRDGFEWKTIPLGAKTLAQKVTAFRSGLDVDALRRGLERVECSQAEAEKRGLSRLECGQVVAKECAQAAADGRGLGRIECHP
jgi:tetratricopeptide (TPR) repeat protein